MKIERSKNAVRNILFTAIKQIYGQLVPFLMRTVMIYTLGMEYLGLNSLFTSVLSVLSLAELGVGSALVFSMYKPIAEDDELTICALMKLYRTYYRIIGLVILIAGSVLIPFIPKLIKGTVPDGMNVYILYIMNLMATVVTYWLFAYKNCLLSAHQRIDVSSKISMGITTIQYAVQIAILIAIKNYYLYILAHIICSIIGNIVTSIVVSKYYPQYHPKGKLEKERVKEINKKVRDLFTAKLGGIITDSVDTIVISSFLGLTLLATYQNYFYIMNAVYAMVTIIFSSCTAGIGNSIVVETGEKNFNDLKKFTLIISWILGFCICCLACLYQPFMELWIGKEGLLDFKFVPCFCAYFYVRQINALLNLYKDAAGLWHQDRFRPLVVSLSNLAMNLIMVQFIGLYGIILSTILSMLVIGIPWILKNLFTVLFHINPKKYIIKLLYYLAISVIACVICVFINNRYINFNSLVVTMIVRAIICALIPNILFFSLCRKSEEFKGSMALVDGLTKGKIKIIKKLY